MIKYKTLGITGLWDKTESANINLSKLIYRKKIDEIKKRFKKNYIEVITGPRQSGKTTLLFMLINELLKKHDYRNILYVNLDTVIDSGIFEETLRFDEIIERAKPAGGRVYLFIDEIQRLKNPGKMLKGLFDLKRNLKIFVSGSSSIEIRSKTKEFLTGRKRETLLYPVSFAEYVDYEGALPGRLNSLKLTKKTLNDWAENEKKYGKYLTGIMENVLITGCYPGVITKKRRDERIEELAELYNSYIKKDIADFMRIENVEVFNRIVKALAGQIGNLLNKAEIGSLTQSNQITLTKYLSILQDTFVTRYLSPFVTQRRNEIKSAGKCFFVDNGLRNFSFRQFGSAENRPDKGMLVENTVVSEILKNIGILQEVFYWRTKGGAEVDIVIRSGQKIIPVEIKSGSVNQGALPRGYHSFINGFSPEYGFLLNRDRFGIEKIKNTVIYYVPFHWFCLFAEKWMRL